MQAERSQQKRAMNGYLIAGVERWHTATEVEKAEYYQESKKMKLEDETQFPPHGYLRSLRSVQLPLHLISSRHAMQCELENIVSHAWIRLRNALQTKLLKPTLRTLKGKIQLGVHGQVCIGMRICIQNLHFPTLAWKTCFKDRVLQSSIAYEKGNCTVVELHDRAEVKRIFSLTKNIDISTVNIDEQRTSCLAPKAFVKLQTTSNTRIKRAFILQEDLLDDTVKVITDVQNSGKQTAIVNTDKMSRRSNVYIKYSKFRESLSILSHRLTFTTQCNNDAQRSVKIDNSRCT